jgi:hypothetical protein
MTIKQEKAAPAATDPATGVDILEVAARTVIGSHVTPLGWPMVGVFVGYGGGSGGWFWSAVPDATLEPWQARQIANQLQTIAEAMVRRAADVEAARLVVMARPEHGGSHV